MIKCQGQVPTLDASRWLQRLCFHFSKKIAVVNDEHQGRAALPSGPCRLWADSEALHFECEADGEEALARSRVIIDEHIKLFSRKAPLAVAWAPAGSNLARPSP